MIISTKKSNRGRKAIVGKVCFDEGRMMIFAGYHQFPDGRVGKILLNLDEARVLANRIGVDPAKNKARRRKQLIRTLAKRYGV